MIAPIGVCRPRMPRVRQPGPDPPDVDILIAAHPDLGIRRAYAETRSDGSGDVKGEASRPSGEPGNAPVQHRQCRKSDPDSSHRNKHPERFL